VPADRIARVIGKAGAGLKQVRDSTSCKVQVQQQQQQSSDGENATRRVDLLGTVEQLVSAFALLLPKAFPEPVCSTTIMIPAEKAGLVVGRAGENLRRVREECHVRLSLEREPTMDPFTQVEERAVSMQGEAFQLVHALRYVLSGGNPVGPGMVAGGFAVSSGQLAGYTQVRGPSTDPDQIQIHMIVPDKYVGAVLGKGGSLVKQTAAAAECKVSMTTREGATDRRAVMVGNYSQCQTAQTLIHEQLLETAKAGGREELGEVAVILFIRKEAAGVVIGKGGASLKHIREKSGARIQLAREEVEGQRPCNILGTLSQVLQAEQLIYELVRAVPVEQHNGTTTGGWPGPMQLAPGMELGTGQQDFTMFAGASKRRGADTSDVATKVLLPAQSAGAVIGRQGSGLKQIRETCGVQVEMLQPVQAPEWPDDRVLILRGSLMGRRLAVEAVLRLSFQMYGDTSCTLKVLVPSFQVGSVIGRQGNMLRSLREQCGVSAQVEREEVQGERLVTAVGLLHQVVHAAVAILTVLENASHTVGSTNGQEPIGTVPPPVQQPAPVAQALQLQQQQQQPQHQPPQLQQHPPQQPQPQPAQLPLQLQPPPQQHVPQPQPAMPQAVVAPSQQPTMVPYPAAQAGMTAAIMAQGSAPLPGHAAFAQVPTYFKPTQGYAS